MDSMTVGQLIDRLKEFDPNLRVVQPSGEDGYEPVRIVAQAAMFDHGKRQWSGQYDTAHYGKETPTTPLPMVMVSYGE